VIAAAWGVATLRPNLDMRQMDFQDPKSREAAQWLFKKLDLRVPLFRIHSEESVVAAATEEKLRAAEIGAEVENVRNYLPTPEVQRKNLASWAAARAMGLVRGPEQRKFFQPFLSSLERRGERGKSRQSYLAHLTHDSKWISLWLPHTDAQEQEIRKAYPDAMSLRDVAFAFPSTLAGELAWMVPLSLVLVSILLFGYYRKLKLTLYALLPFVSGLGMVTVASYGFGAEISFISLIGLVMVFGFSIDYGIFVTDAHRENSHDTPEGVWTAVTLAGLTNLAGFAPLVFCHHPVLRHLGQALFFGTLGTYLGAAWGIPALMIPEASKGASA
jgi:hypothetical protein